MKVKKFRKNDEKILSGGGEVQNQKIRKNDEKRRFRRSKFKKSEKMIEKTFQEVKGQSSKSQKK
jgi:hypothetical protein